MTSVTQSNGKATFFVESRLHGYAREYARDTTLAVARKFKVRGVTQRRVVPHITLYGPGETDNIRKVISSIQRVARDYDLVPFKIKGFGSFNRNQKVVYFDIEPSTELQQLQKELCRELMKVSSCQPWDKERDFSFHTTVAFKDIDTKFDRIWAYLQHMKMPDITQHLLRITVVDSHSKITCEYDLLLKRLLNRSEALSPHIWRKTTGRLRELGGLPKTKRLSLWQRFNAFVTNALRKNLYSQ